MKMKNKLTITINYWFIVICKFIYIWKFLCLQKGITYNFKMCTGMCVTCANRVCYVWVLMHFTGFWGVFQKYVEIEVVDVVVVDAGCNHSLRHRTTNRFVQGQKKKRKEKNQLVFS